MMNTHEHVGCQMDGKSEAEHCQGHGYKGDIHLFMKSLKVMSKEYLDQMSITTYQKQLYLI